MDISVFRKLC
uniref:Uncharacterized protein n=1 Tax=Rhizophora mucronata TaxID=61149 RepID=A0A2P2P7E7_RHIMU